MSQRAIWNLRMGAIALSLAATLAGAPVVINSLAKHGYSTSMASPVDRLMSLLDARSPGERATGELALTKQKVVKTANFVKPSERALGKIVHPKPSATAEFIRAIAPPAPDVSLLAVVPPMTLADVIPPVTSAPPLNGGVGIPTVIGSSSGPSSPTPLGLTPPIPTPAPAVPEPATWLMMILGFGMIGRSLRKRRSNALARLRTA